MLPLLCVYLYFIKQYLLCLLCLHKVATLLGVFDGGVIQSTRFLQQKVGSGRLWGLWEA